MTSDARVGDAQIHRAFLQSHVAFLIEFQEVQKLAAKLFDLAMDKYNNDVETDTTNRLAQIYVYYLCKATFDAFYDVFVLAGNCRGFAAKMMLRSMYEHLVEAHYLASKPEEAKLFNDHSAIEKWKVWMRAVEVIPQLKETVPAEDVARLEEMQKKARRNVEHCKKCGQPVTDEAWTRVSLDTKAKQVDEATGTSLLNLYGPCYQTPTAVMHATPLGLEMRLKETAGGNHIYNEMPETVAHDSLLRAHGLVLRLFKHLNGYFALGLDGDVESRWLAFPKIWNGALVEPPPMTGWCRRRAATAGSATRQPWSYLDRV
jgi:hypothetical protein